MQSEAFDFPTQLFEKRVHHVTRTPPEAELVRRAVSLLQSSQRPLLIAGGGVLYSEAWQALDSFARVTGIPVAETQAGKGSLPWDHPRNVGPIGVDGRLGRATSWRVTPTWSLPSGHA